MRGFGYPSYHYYWMGNHLLWRMTMNDNYKLKIDLQQRDTGKWFFAEYRAVRVLSEQQGYQLLVGWYDTIRYDTRCYFNVRSKADISQLNLPHGTDNYKSVKTEKLKSKKTDMLRSNRKQSGKSI